MTDADATLPVSETLVVSTQSAGGSVLLRGRLQAPLGAFIVAPTDGQVAQVAVRPGQEVRSGQQLIALSTAKAANNSELAPAENRQSRAEAAQIVAAKRQQAWQKRVNAAHERLEAAQQRVQIAQARVAEARSVVRRLQNGETVNSDDLADHNENTPQNMRNNAPLRATTQEGSRRLQARADELAQMATSKRSEARAAAAQAEEKQKQWLAAQDIADKLAIASVPTSKPSTPPAETDDEDGNSHTSKAAPERDNFKRRAAQDYANSLKLKADAAEAHATSLQRKADRLTKRATAVRSQAKSTLPRVAASLHNLRVFDNEDSSPRLDAGESANASHAKQGSTSQTPERGTPISVAQAARLTQEALAESREAIANAERVRREVAGFEQPVENTREQFDDATRRLDAAQERVWNAASLANPNVRTVLASSDGIVLWVTEVAREVKTGDPLAKVGRADRLEVVLHDTSDAWKTLRPGSVLMTLVQNVTKPSATQQVQGVPVSAKVLGVRPPQHPGMEAVVRVAIHNPRQEDTANTQTSVPPEASLPPIHTTRRPFAPGTPVVCSLPTQGVAAGIAIPSDAIRRDGDGSRYVAVLTPIIDTNTDDIRCRVEWRRVQVGRGDGFQNLILAGLEIGERIALRPAIMQEFLQTHGKQATLRIVQA
jgi:hypothetical protein